MSHRLPLPKNNYCNSPRQHWMFDDYRFRQSGIDTYIVWYEHVLSLLPDATPITHMYAAIYIAMNTHTPICTHKYKKSVHIHTHMHVSRRAGEDTVTRMPPPSSPLWTCLKFPGAGARVEGEGHASLVTEHSRSHRTWEPIPRASRLGCSSLTLAQPHARLSSRFHIEVT